jgi:hypothetical protein
VEVTVDQKVQFHGNGGLEQTSKIELVCFSKKQYRKTYPIQQGIAQAFVELSAKREELQSAFRQRREDVVAKPEDAKKKAEKEDDADPMKDPAFIELIMTMSTVDIEPLMEIFDNLALAGCVKIEGNTIQPFQLDELDPKTQDQLFFGYLANFIVSLAI